MTQPSAPSAPSAGMPQRLDAAGLAAWAQRAAGAGETVLRIDLAGAGDRAAMLARIAAGLGFPAHFGGNLDALFDCLTDLAVPPAGLACVLAGFPARTALAAVRTAVLIGPATLASARRMVPTWSASCTRA